MTTAACPAPALLFDLDGTLAATDHLHFEAFKALMAAHGRTLSMAEYEARILGRSNAIIMQHFFPDLPVAEHRRLADEKEAAFRDIAAGQLTPTAGLLDLLAWAAARDVAVGVVTNAPRANAEMVLGALGLADRFRTLVIADEVAHAKPHPLPYQTGAARLGSAAKWAIAFEDSISGVQAAHAAGMPVVGLTTTLAAEPLIEAGAAFAAADFTDRRIYDLAEVQFRASAA